MTPVRFVSHDVALLGMFDPAQTSADTALAVLICNPFGQEAIRTHRTLKVLAERLAREGADVLRFDYFATGDSPGDDAEVDCDRWRADIAAAHAELLRRTRARTITWIGVRLGATLAAAASSDLPAPPQRLVLWEPIFNGAEYLQQLAAAHTRHMVATLGHAGTTMNRVDTEALGFALPAHFVRQVNAITIDSLAAARANETLIVAPAQSLQAFNQHVGRWHNAGSVGMRPFETPFDWTSEEALNSALVPAPAVSMLCSLAIGAA